MPCSEIAQNQKSRGCSWTWSNTIQHRTAHLIRHLSNLKRVKLLLITGWIRTFLLYNEGYSLGVTLVTNEKIIYTPLLFYGNVKKMLVWLNHNKSFSKDSNNWNYIRGLNIILPKGILSPGVLVMVVESAV